jgi:hypothetical protein
MNIDDYSTVWMGFTNEKLELLSQVHSRFDGGFSHWASSESEFSSFGKTFRKWSSFPSFLPLYICSDHAVHWESKCWLNEIASPYSVFFTWNAKKNKKMNLISGKRSYYVPHPWVSYRKKNYKKLQSLRRSGTLVFFPHSNENSNPFFNNLDEYINQLKSLPVQYTPIVICLLYSDIEKDLHIKLRKYNIPLITAGTMISQKFVDRFYKMLLSFEYSTSPNIGSHAFYSIEAGVPFFLYGDSPTYQIKNSKMVSDGELNLQDYGDEEDINNLNRLQSLLSYGSILINEELQNIVNTYMGLDSNMTKKGMFFILFVEFFSHLDEFIISYYKRFFNHLFKLINFERQ